MRSTYLLLFLLPVLLFSCKNTKTVTENTVITELDPIVIKPAFEGYRETATKEHALVHTRLEVSFDWEKQYLYGKANITLTPYFYPTNTLTLDAKGFDLHKVALVDGENTAELKYTYDTLQLHITLPKTYTRQDTFEILIDYTAKPNELAEGGSAAITSDKGLYFINPLGEEPGKPKQIWTQGETESSSCWFPTIDKPNQKTTQEIYMTVDTQYVTLSNGLNRGAVFHEDGTRTDHWHQQLPHAPYLFMMTVGKYAKIDTSWDGLPVSYYVEPEYRDDAVAIFGNTPQMLEFFSKRLGYRYNWEKYSQIVARDYVSGAMENTTANLYFSAIQRTKKELEDYDFEAIIAHELIHQWFGDLLTCESWSNLPLNESFANYGEYLWIEHKYGKNEAELHRLSEKGGYLGEAKSSKKQLIRFYYNDKEDMFDAHSYNKGGLILNMLRDYLGDDAFFSTLKRYILDNQYAAVEYTQLRLAFEEVTGQDWNWFFNQWFLAAGHPELTISKTFDTEAKTVTVNVAQTQVADGVPSVFKLPFYIDIYEGGKVRREKVVMDKREQQFTFNYTTMPNLVNVDATKTMLAVKQEEKPLNEWIFQYKNGPEMMDKIEAIDAMLANYIDSSAAIKVLLSALDDDYDGLREYVVDRIPLESSTPDFNNIKAYLIKLAKDDPKNSVAASAVYRLATLSDESLLKVYEDIVTQDRSYLLTASALDAIFAQDEAKAYMLAKNFNDAKNADIVASVSAAYAAYGDKDDQAFFERTIPAAIGYVKYTLLSNYGDFLINQSVETMEEGIPTLKTFAIYASPWWDRYGATASIFAVVTALRDQIATIKAEAGEDGASSALTQGQLKPYEDLLAQLEADLAEIKAKEKSESVQRRYSKFE